MTATVIQAAAKTALSTPDNVRMDLGLTAATAPNERLERLIEQASADASEFCNRIFGLTTYRERFEAWHDRIEPTHLGLVLSELPVVEILGVTIDDEEVEPTEYEFEGRHLYRIVGVRRQCWRGCRILVEYKAGWHLPSVSGSAPAGVPKLPANIEGAISQLVGMRRAAAGRDPSVRSESTEGVGSTSYAVPGSAGVSGSRMAALAHPEARATLEQYRREFPL